MAAADTPALRVEHLSKSFGAVHALRDVSLTVSEGSIHALLGRNGSGKSTLIKILSGYHTADSGEIWIGGDHLADDPALRRAMGYVHQDLAVLGRLTVLENVAIGRQYPMRRGRIDWSRLRRDVAAVLGPFQLEARIDEPLDALSKGEAAIVAIGRALYEQSGLRVLVLDEPTSSLPAAERPQLFATMRQLARRGIAVLFVTHHLREAVAVCDSATVLRDGRVVATHSGGVPDETTLAREMIGTVTALGSATVVEAERAAGRALGGSQLVLDQACGSLLRDVSLTVARGEVVAVVGLLGSGLEELALVASGRSDPTSGMASLETDGRRLPLREAARRGLVGLVPAERLTQALLARLPVRENITISAPARHIAGLRISVRQERRTVREWADRLSLLPRNPEAPIEALSGGNQQKVVLARWLQLRPAVLVAAEPTQGVDVAAKRDLLHQLRAAAEVSAVLIVSHEPEEVLPICDRIVVMRDGRLVAELRPEDAAVESLLEAYA